MPSLTKTLPPGRKSGRSGTTEIYGKNGKSQIGQNDDARHFFAQVRGFEDFGRVRGALGGSIFVRFLFGCGSVKRRTEQLRNRPNRTFYRTEHKKNYRTEPPPNRTKLAEKTTEPNRTTRFGRPLVATRQFLFGTRSVSPFSGFTSKLHPTEFSSWKKRRGLDPA